MSLEEENSINTENITCIEESIMSLIKTGNIIMLKTLLDNNVFSKEFLIDSIGTNIDYLLPGTIEEEDYTIKSLEFILNAQEESLNKNRAKILCDCLEYYFDIYEKNKNIDIALTIYHKVIEIVGFYPKHSYMIAALPENILSEELNKITESDQMDEIISYVCIFGTYETIKICFDYYNQMHPKKPIVFYVDSYQKIYNRGNFSKGEKLLEYLLYSFVEEEYLDKYVVANMFNTYSGYIFPVISQGLIHSRGIILDETLSLTLAFLSGDNSIYIPKLMSSYDKTMLSNSEMRKDILNLVYGQNNFFSESLSEQIRGIISKYY